MNEISPLWKHQIEAFERGKNLDGFGLFFEMGAGKTKTAIEFWRHKCNTHKRFLKTLVLCPPIVIRNWKDEFLKNSKVTPDQVVLLTGPGAKRLKDFKAIEGAKIVVTNYESLLMEDLFEAFQDWGIEVIILDESHKCKEPKTERTKRAVRLANGKRTKTGEWVHYPIRYRYILSGSPILNSPLDLFSQYLILDGGETFGQNQYVFRAEYFYDKNAGMPKHKYFPDWRIREGALERINAKIQATSMRVEKKDCMDLPDLVRQTVKVDMTPDQAKAYKAMKQDFLAFVKDPKGGDHTAVAKLALEKALRLQQIASGFVKAVDGKNVSFEKTPKIDALKELLTELTPHSKVIVWAVWKENYEQIRNLCDDLKIRYVEVHGETPANQRFENVDVFNHDSECRVFLGHPGSGGIGINLVVAPYSVFFSRTFSLEHSLQAEARNHRGGSEIHDKITRIDLVAADTIDELVQKALANKLEISDKVLRAEIALELKKQEN